jgi:hypothetical protein
VFLAVRGSTLVRTSRYMRLYTVLRKYVRALVYRSTATNHMFGPKLATTLGRRAFKLLLLQFKPNGGIIFLVSF